LNFRNKSKSPVFDINSAVTGTRFIDELFSIRSGFVPVAVLMQSVGPTPTPFNAVGLSFPAPPFQLHRL
jgi:hypothetical protein